MADPGVQVQDVRAAKTSTEKTGAGPGNVRRSFGYVPGCRRRDTVLNSMIWGRRHKLHNTQTQKFRKEKIPSCRFSLSLIRLPHFRREINMKLIIITEALLFLPLLWMCLTSGVRR